jgi:hypothetical protein
VKTKLAKIACPIVLGAALIAGCGSTNAGPDSATAPGPASTAAVPSSAQAAPPANPLTQEKINPNIASTSELAAAFEAAGVPNADKWAHEVEEYGPYTPESIEPTLTKELGKYGIDDATLATLLSVLAPQ